MTRVINRTIRPGRLFQLENELILVGTLAHKRPKKSKMSTFRLNDLSKRIELRLS